MELNFDLIKNHKQTKWNSCIPMSVECVLKLLKFMDGSVTPFQNDDDKLGTSYWVKGLTYPEDNPKVKFSREFFLEEYKYENGNLKYGEHNSRGQHFFDDGYYDDLFIVIDDELKNGRYVIISLSSGEGTYHMEVIYNKIDERNYNTITFYENQFLPSFLIHDLKARVRYMQGTDILTYKPISQYLLH